MRSRKGDVPGIWRIWVGRGRLWSVVSEAWRRQFEIALNRMCEGRLGAADEGYSALLPDAPGVPEMQERFRKLREEYEQTMAQQRVRELLMSPEKED